MNRLGNPPEDAARLADIERRIVQLQVEVQRLQTIVERLSAGRPTGGQTSS